MKNTTLHRNLQSPMERELLFGVAGVLVIRVVAFDRSTTASEAQLSDDVFGTLGGDTVNLKSQVEQCSSGNLRISASSFSSMIGSDGVYTVQLPSTVISGANDRLIVNSVLDKLSSDFGWPLNQLAHFVMICLPPGTAGNWIAYAYVNHWLSVYNDIWCQYPSAQLHEIGKS